jgi:pimeloyl-ACP methyl ester carboxylesterase
MTARASGFHELPDGTELYYERRGRGRPLLLVHGLFGLVEHWRFQVPVFAREWDVVSVDLRGSGRSTKPEVDVYPIEQHADDLACLLAGLEINEPAVVAGHSMGSCVAIELALSRPELLAGLILVDGFACGEHCLVAFEQMREGVSRKTTLVELFKRVSFGQSFRWNPEGERLADWCASEAAKLPLFAIYASARGFTQYDSRPRLASLSVPTLVVVGEEDWSCPLDPSSRYLADTIPGSRLEVVHAGHFPMLEAPTAFNKLLAEFLGIAATDGGEPL